MQPVKLEGVREETPPPLLPEQFSTALFLKVFHHFSLLFCLCPVPPTPNVTAAALNPAEQFCLGEEALQESFLSPTPWRRLVLLLSVTHVDARTWKRDSCWILCSLFGPGAVQGHLHLHPRQLRSGWGCIKRGIFGFPRLCF